MTDYDIIASHFSHTRKYVWDDLKPFLQKIKHGSKVLDLGCGNGRIVKMLNGKSVSYLGLDKSKELILRAKKHYSNYQFRLADITLPGTYHGLGGFDYVLMIAVLHHIQDKKDQEMILQNILACLKPNGSLFLTVWNMYQEKYQGKINKNKVAIIPYHLSNGKETTETVRREIRAFDKKELENMVKKAGFHIIRAYYSTRGLKTDINKGQNLCFELKKVV